VIFLPRGAVVIDIVPENNEDKSPWVVYMCADFKPLFISPITIPPQKTVLQMAKVRRTKEWAMLSPYWRQRILREGVCPEVHYGPLTGFGRQPHWSQQCFACQVHVVGALHQYASCIHRSLFKCMLKICAVMHLLSFAGRGRGLADGHICCVQLSVVSQVGKSGP